MIIICSTFANFPMWLRDLSHLFKLLFCLLDDLIPGWDFFAALQHSHDDDRRIMSVGLVGNDLENNADKREKIG